MSAAPPPHDDPRIKVFTYNENEVYRLDLYLKAVTAIQFSDEEEVQSILIGDSSSWEVVKLKNGNVVSIKPIAPSASTNMTIYSNKHVYSFDLRSYGEIPPGQENSTVSRMAFRYPGTKKPAADQPTDVRGPINAAYMVSGQSRFRPAGVLDDGRQTTFVLPVNAPRPAIFKVGFDKKESLVNSRTRGNTVIVDGLSDFWVLRIGDEQVCVGRDDAIKQNKSFLRLLGVQSAGR